MSTEKNQPYVQLCMRRNLLNLVNPNLPEGYTVRSYDAGDSKYWNDIINTAFERQNMDFNQIMRTDGSFRENRVLFVCKNDIPVSTASAWYKPEWGIKSGYLHMVGTLPDHAGKGLGLQVSLAAMHQMAAEGMEDVVLLTDDYRIPAIKTYLKLGFEPLITHENQQKRWSDVFQEVEKPELIQTFKKCFEAELFNDDDPRLNMDYPKRYKSAHRWHADRTHRLGTALTDALGDESLYKSSELGSAAVEPAILKAASKSPLLFTYITGKESLPMGSKVSYYLDGQGTLYKNGKIQEESLTVTTSGNCKIKPFLFGFEVTEGTLEYNDHVCIQVEAFNLTPIANKYEIKVLIQKSKEEPIKRLPEPLILNVQPLEIKCLQVQLPCTYKKETYVKVKITTRDKFDNRVPYTGNVIVIHNELKQKIHMTRGYAEFEATLNSGNTETIYAAFINDEKIYKSNPCVNSENQQLFIGDLHAHDFLSAAHGYTDRVYEWGRDDKGLDFLSVAVQNHGWTDNEKWVIAKHMNERYLDEGTFVTFLACEWQHSGYGDKVIHFLGGDQPFFSADDRRTNSAEKLYEAVKASDALIVSHHTAYNQNQWCGGTDYDVIDTDIERLMELWSMHGSSEGFNNSDRPLINMDFDNTVIDMLKNGLKIGFTAGSDTHSGRPGGSAKEPRPYWGGLTAVWAPSKTRRSIFTALYNRHTYALTDARIVLKMSVNGALMGSEIESGESADIYVEVWAPSVIEKVQIIKNSNKYLELSVGAEYSKIEQSDETKSGDYYHCRVILKDGNLAVSSPVWIK